MKHRKRLYRSSSYRIFAGVASGVAEYLHTGAYTIRFLFILLTFMSGVGVVLYCILAIILPSQEVVLEQEGELYFDDMIHGRPVESDNPNALPVFQNPGNIVAMGIILVGAIFLQTNIIPWALIPLSLMLPGLLIVLAILLLLKSFTYKYKKR